MTTAPAAFHPNVAEEQVAVLTNTIVNGEYRHLVVATSPLAAAAAPGQFYQLLCPQPPGETPFLRRPMSVYAADPTTKRVEFLYKVTGAGTRGLATLSPGDTMQVLGPLGRGYTLDPAWKHIVAIGRGAGLATLGPLAQTAQKAGIGVTAILSARTVVTITDSQGNSGPAHVERLLRGLIADGRCDAFFTCGSARLLRVQQRLAREFSLPGQVAMEQQMACGLGMCFCCVRDFNIDGEIVHKRVCWDGPVFDIMEALP
jgi:dihydroorotate dehydrogenase electron transfer subunit